jgi:hypothetical protein
MKHKMHNHTTTDKLNLKALKYLRQLNCWHILIKNAEKSYKIYMEMQNIKKTRRLVKTWRMPNTPRMVKFRRMVKTWGMLKTRRPQNLWRLMKYWHP